MLPQELLVSLPPLLPEQEYLRPFAPTVVGNLEFRVWRKQLERIDEILRRSQAEAAFVRLSLVRQREREKGAAEEEGRPVHLLTPGEQVLFQQRASQALRCMLVRQAHERIIGERQVTNEEKILSLYEGHAAVYARGKAGAEVEFGSQLLLGEAESGVIVDWELVCGNPERDTKLLGRSLDRYEAARAGKAPAAVSGDRGFDSRANRAELAERRIYHGICPKAARELRQRMREARFARLQQRRSQTEARIGIFKNGFLGAPVRAKGYAHQKLQVAWAVLTHNLWCIARQPRTKTIEVVSAGALSRGCRTAYRLG